MSIQRQIKPLRAGAGELARGIMVVAFNEPNGSAFETGDKFEFWSDKSLADDNLQGRPPKD